MSSVGQQGHARDRARYTHGHHESVLRTHAWRTVENSAAYLVPHLRAGASVLDVGCGPGTVTVDLAHRVAPGRVVGVDLSPEVVARAAREARGAGAPGAVDVEFVVADLFALPFADDSFDVVHAHQVLQHVHDPVGALVEMRRVARPGGVVAVREVDYGATAWAPSSTGLERWIDVYDRVHRANGGEPDAGRHLRGWALAAGFAEVTSSASVWCFASDAERAWWGGAWAERATRSSFAEQAISSGAATAVELDDIAAAWLAWREDPAGTLLMPHGEVLARA